MTDRAINGNSCLFAHTKSNVSNFLLLIGRGFPRLTRHHSLRFPPNPPRPRRHGRRLIFRRRPHHHPRRRGALPDRRRAPLRRPRADAPRLLLIRLRAQPGPHQSHPLTTTVVTVLRVRRLGPHQHLQIRRPEALPTVFASANAGEAASSAEERAKDILVVVSGLLFGFGCGALTAASMYLVWSLLASTCASSYDDVYSDDEDDHLLSEAESPKKAGYVIIHDTQEYATGKN
ncbi:hypothetical protein PR202_gb18318 [Eleusine coracana subsp. coracana]|uniref:Uncharacterized protein n=1 Tax=Eleusine coracana subsp. coracana TaxID=191504 RepID=A0AAV5F2Z0_ELECO|nr:hypothetical protein PR202_gb18318 [Eleusine coracana subsp. coracana]